MDNLFSKDDSENENENIEIGNNRDSDISGEMDDMIEVEEHEIKVNDVINNDRLIFIASIINNFLLD